MAELVSVMIVTHNGLPYLREAVRSVLDQTYHAVELVVLDDGSTDDTASFLRKHRGDVVYFRQDRGGIAAARNTAATLARGAYLTFLDADDLMRPRALAKMAATLSASPDLDIVFAHVDEFLSPDLNADMRRRLRAPGRHLPGRLPTTMLCRRAVFFSVGGFDTSLRRGVTLDWTARALERGVRTCMLPDVLYDRRLHARNNGIVERASTNDYLKVIKAAVDRRRAAAGSRDG